MLSEATRATIRQAHQEGRPGDPRDSEFIVEQLTSMRRALLPDLPDELHEEIAAWLVCFIAPAKTDTFRGSAELICSQFEGIAERRDLRLRFINCVKPAALYVRALDDLEQDLSLYFDLAAIFPSPGSSEISRTNLIGGLLRSRRRTT